MDFVAINGFPDYFINKLGVILSRRCPKERIMKSYLTNEGYYYICLYKDKKQKHRFIHRLLALQFILNPDNLDFVDHIDRCKTNNSLSNLRWASRELNQQNATRRKDNKFGQKNISLKVNKKNGKEYTYYLFKITRHKKTHRKVFKTLEEAIAHKIEYLTNLGEEII